jgi:hypothetical protein
MDPGHFVHGAIQSRCGYPYTEAEAPAFARGQPRPTVQQSAVRRRALAGARFCRLDRAPPFTHQTDPFVDLKYRPAAAATQL